MGIDKRRFEGNFEVPISKFFCGRCDDVVSDPILTKDCQHYICRACAAEMINNVCPTCGSNFNDYEELSVALIRIYSSINVKCINNKCEESLTIENYAEHERKCPEGFYVCPNLCGFKSRLSFDEAQRAHNCIEVLQNRVVALEGTNAELWSLNEALNIRNKELETENQRIVTAADQQTKRRARCAIILSDGENFYRCFTCQIRRLSVICVSCFENGQHDGHRYSALVADSNSGAWYCDCGDTEALQPATAACTIHKLN